MFSGRTVGQKLQADAPALATALQYLQSLFNPDRETPERCLFPNSLFSKLFVEAVVPPVLAVAVLAAVSLPWHFSSFSCGLRAACDAKRALVDKLNARRKGKRLVTIAGLVLQLVLQTLLSLAFQEIRSG